MPRITTAVARFVCEKLLAQSVNRRLVWKGHYSIGSVNRDDMQTHGLYVLVTKPGSRLHFEHEYQCRIEPKGTLLTPSDQLASDGSGFLGQFTSVA